MIYKILEKFFKFFLYFSVLIFCLSTGFLILYLIVNGIKSISLELLFGKENVIDVILMKTRVFDGIYSAIFGSFILVFLTMIFSIPLGVLSGVYFAEYSRKNRAIEIILDTLASIPSIVTGLFGLSIIIFINKLLYQDLKPSLLLSSIALSVLVLPYIIRSTQIALESVPFEIKVTALSVGATKIQNIFYVLIPYCLSSIISGVLMATARALSDVAVIMLTGAVILYGIPKTLFDPFEALPFYIFFSSAEYRTEDDVIKTHGASFILLITCLILFTFSLLIGKATIKIFMIKRV